VTDTVFAVSLIIPDTPPRVYAVNAFAGGASLEPEHPTTNVTSNRARNHNLENILFVPIICSLLRDYDSIKLIRVADHERLPLLLENPDYSEI
jgi:hypothetical protein